MSIPTIEFLVHPPSPKAVSQLNITLPPVSTLLQEVNHLGPSLHMPSPTLSFASYSSSASSPLISPLLSPLLLSDSEEQENPIKRKRGRPPNNRREKKEQFTFTTPTVCDSAHAQTTVAEEHTLENFVVLQWQEKNNSDVSSISTPKRRRGRKPKTQLAGNLCFVWRDPTIHHYTNKKIKEKSL
ncbi:hypothetical protein A0J61_01114 [Choanephora cucurbitarum]|uniref:Uncharacterized protein n=1 Tax=Choanephora cucurbitarum TaxID=101091 RepID=A0A1C7NP03_9FUNG|nr:hypothetical protein A0J61_01114 [Choanephora cucurbitarum]